MVRKAHELRTQSGILAKPPIKQGKVLGFSDKVKIDSFFNDDRYSRAMPGMKDKVSISKNVHRQKRLLLCTLKELYAQFKSEHHDVKVSFSKFCLLRPKYCVYAGSSQTHSVCVCTYHQNVTLLLDAAKIEDSYQELIDTAICSDATKDCHLMKCSNCPNKQSLKRSILEQLDGDVLNEIITFKE